MAYKVVPYEDLRTKILDSIRTLAKNRNYNPKAIDELFEVFAKNIQKPEALAIKYGNISAKRRKQIGFLLSVIRCLDDSTKEPENKAYLLHAATFYVRERIDVSYDPTKSWLNYFASFGTTVDVSNLYTLLGFSLKLSPDNVPTYKEFIAMYGALKDFIGQHVYKDPNNLIQGYLALEQQSFSSIKIEDFKAEKFFAQLIDRIAALEKQAVAETLKKHNKGTKSYRIFVPAESSSALSAETNPVLNIEDRLTPEELDYEKDNQENTLTY